MQIDTETLLPLPPEGVELHSPDAPRHVFTTGFSAADANGRWTDGPRSRLVFRLPRRSEGGVELRLESLGFVVQGAVFEQQAELLAGGRAVGRWNVMSTTLVPRLVVVPREAMEPDGTVVLEFRIPTCMQPALVGQGDDRRFLGLMMRRLSWEARPPQRPHDLSGELARPVGRESRKSFADKIASGFWSRFVTGPAVLDVGFQGASAAGSVVPILPGAIGVDIDYSGYDGRILPFADDSQDAVYSSHCLEHIPDNIKAIQEWHRVVKVGGHIITVVPSAHLYERKRRVPSYWNGDHRRTYTPSSLLMEFEAALAPNSYRVRHLAENDANYQYGLPPNMHPEGCHEIELVVEKIAPPLWRLGE